MLKKKIIKSCKRMVVKWAEPKVPPKGELIVVCDGKAARLAAERTVEYAVSQGRKARFVTADSYSKYRLKAISSKNKIIVIGHHEIAHMEAMKTVCKYGELHGMTYSVSGRMCVLQAKGKNLHSKTEFGEYYGHVMAEHRDLAQQYAIPLHYIKEGKEKDRSTLESQYDLLWVLFAAEELPLFLGLEDCGDAEQPEPPKTPGRCQPAGYASVLLEQFKLEAPDSFCITEDYLEQFCQSQQRFSLPPQLSSQEDCQWDPLLERNGWQVRRLRERDSIGIFDPGGQCRAAGTGEQLFSPILNHIHAQAKINALRMDHRLSRGIVLEGGGAKGAFQLGVWKWLEEQGGLQHFTGISGASVGALNSLLFAQGDYSKAERLWMSMEDGDLVKPNKALSKNIGKTLSGMAFEGDAAWDKLLNVLPEFSSCLEEHGGLFSKEKYETIVRENISQSALGEKLTFVSLSAITMIDLQNLAGRDSVLCAEYSYLDPRCADPLEMNVRKVLASAAYPGAYAPVKIDEGSVLTEAPWTTPPSSPW